MSAQPKKRLSKNSTLLGAINSIILERKKTPPSPWGSTVHPERTHFEQMKIVSIGRAELDKLTKDFEAIYPVLLVVIEYCFTFDPGPHFTAFGIDIRRIGPPHKPGWAAGLIVPSMGHIP